LDIDYKKIPKQVPTRWNSVCKTIKAITKMAPAFSQILGSGEIEGKFQDKLPSDQTVMSLIHLLQPLEQIKSWSELLEADNTPMIQFVIPALVNLCNITKTKEFEKCPSKATKTFCRQFEFELKKGTKKTKQVKASSPKALHKSKKPRNLSSGVTETTMTSTL
jgi:hypothetical protein